MVNVIIFTVEEQIWPLWSEQWLFLQYNEDYGQLSSLCIGFKALTW